MFKPQFAEALGFVDKHCYLRAGCGGYQPLQMEECYTGKLASEGTAWARGLQGCGLSLGHQLQPRDSLPPAQLLLTLLLVT